jgi:hypothetical protein
MQLSVVAATVFEVPLGVDERTVEVVKGSLFLS